MRRTTCGFVGVTLLVGIACAVGTLELAPTHGRGNRPAAVAAPSPAPAPAAASGDATIQPATVLSKVTPPVPASTLLASPKAGSSYLLYWLDPKQPIMGEMGATTWGGPTVRPVVATKGNLLQIRLDSRPNGSTGWVRKEDVTLTTSPYRIVISVSARSLTLYQNGWQVYSAPVGVGKPQWPTPLGPSFVDALYPVGPRQQRIYGPVVLITASHSNVFTEFDGGDGTVGIHGYPSDPASTMGVASSHGCIRASPLTMATISQVPPGTPIDFVA